MGKNKAKSKTTKAAAPAAAAPADKSQSGPQRTPQNPFEHSEETLYAVDKILNLRWSKGSRQYLVRWEGYDESHDTWDVGADGKSGRLRPPNSSVRAAAT